MIQDALTLNCWLKTKGFAIGSVVKFRSDRMYNSVTALSDSDVGSGGEGVPPSQPRPEPKPTPQSKASGKSQNAKKKSTPANETSGV